MGCYIGVTNRLGYFSKDVDDEMQMEAPPGFSRSLKGNRESRSIRHPAVTSSSFTIDRKNAEDIVIKAGSYYPRRGDEAEKWEMPVTCHMFMYVLKDAERVWRERESVRAFITRYTDEIAQSTRLNEDQRIAGFVLGLKIKLLVKFISTDHLESYDSLMENTYEWLQAEETTFEGRPITSMDNNHIDKTHKGRLWEGSGKNNRANNEIDLALIRSPIMGFCRTLRSVLRESLSQKGRNMEAYVDDMVIKGMDKEDMLIFDRLGIINKCSFGIEEGKFLGHILSKHGIKDNTAKLKALTNIKQPRTIKEVQSLHVLCGLKVLPPSRFLKSLLLLSGKSRAVCIHQMMEGLVRPGDAVRIYPDAVSRVCKEEFFFFSSILARKGSATLKDELPTSTGTPEGLAEKVTAQLPGKGYSELLPRSPQDHQGTRQALRKSELQKDVGHRTKKYLGNIVAGPLLECKPITRSPDTTQRHKERKLLSKTNNADSSNNPISVPFHLCHRGESLRTSIPNDSSHIRPTIEPSMVTSQVVQPNIRRPLQLLNSISESPVEGCLKRKSPPSSSRDAFSRYPELCGRNVLAKCSLDITLAVEHPDFKVFEKYSDLCQTNAVTGTSKPSVHVVRDTTVVNSQPNDSSYIRPTIKQSVVTPQVVQPDIRRPLQLLNSISESPVEGIQDSASGCLKRKSSPSSSRDAFSRYSKLCGQNVLAKCSLDTTLAVEHPDFNVFEKYSNLCLTNAVTRTSKPSVHVVRDTSVVNSQHSFSEPLSLNITERDALLDDRTHLNTPIGGVFGLNDGACSSGQSEDSVLFGGIIDNVSKKRQRNAPVIESSIKKPRYTAPRATDRRIANELIISITYKIIGNPRMKIDEDEEEF
uniref:Reverse transcriptase domain-containing protein n=1 Tax=Tanacetum cinerariifolium TaxID=118510 RepID=A0A6L2NEM5_TANCI|nr:reverse transcriptase domain-containing protein [Tanacetum cinerariifolium]